MSLPCRCTKCKKRKSIRRARWMELGKNIKNWKAKCPSCGNKKWYVDRYRLKHELGVKPSCDCGGYHFRHRHGSGWCYFHPQAEQKRKDRVYDVPDFLRNQENLKEERNGNN